MSTCKKYILIIDFEANCTDKDTQDHEIVEFPCILLDALDGSIVNEFRRLVSMTHHAQLSEFIVNLTGITDEDMKKESIPWFKALNDFVVWLLILNNINLHDCNVVTFGDWDLGWMLPLQTRTTQVSLQPVLEDLFNSWLNIKKFMVDNFCETQSIEGRVTIPKLLECFGKEFSGYHHSGIADCRNIATLVKHCIDCGHDMSVTNRNLKDHGSKFPSKNTSGV